MATNSDNSIQVEQRAYCVIHGKLCLSASEVPYFFGYKTEFVFFQNNPKDLDPSYKMDLDLLDCLGWVKLIL